MDDFAFYANDLESHISINEFVARPHGHDFYLTVLFTHGKGFHEIDFKQYPVSSGTVFMIRPGQFHRMEVSPDAAGYIFFHSAAFYNLHIANPHVGDYPFFGLPGATPMLKLDKESQPWMTTLFKRVIDSYRNKNIPQHTRLLVALIDLVYIELSVLYQPARNEAEKSPLYLQKIAELNRLIDLHFMTLRSAGAYADKMYTSTKHLNRICQEVLGKTTTDLIAERIVLEAKRMLITAERPIKDVAQELGFDDPAYFIRLFKKHAGESPSMFIKNRQ
jgi:AraC family transcriptional activator of pobA